MNDPAGAGRWSDPVAGCRLPVLVLAVARDAAGRSSNDQSGNDMKLVFTDLDGRMTGFALTGARTPEPGQLVAQRVAAGA